MNKILLSLFILVFFVNGADAQPDIPVDHQSGRPMITVPLWEIREGEIQVPLQLHYDASGVKLADESGWVGLKWGLGGQGSITRVLNGLPDDLKPTTTDARAGWLENGNAPMVSGFDASAAAAGCSGSAWNTLNGFNYLRDTEPDLFFIDAPGLAGKFMFDKQGIPRPLPYQQLKFDVTKGSDGKINEIKITNNQGTVYTFGHVYAYDNSIEKSIRSVELGAQNAAVDYLNKEFGFYKNPVSYNSKWHLKKIETASGKKLDYYYDTHMSFDPNYPAYISSVSSTNLYTRCNLNATNCEGKSEYTIKTEATKSILREIRSSTTWVVFNTGTFDMNNDPFFYLQKIQVFALDGGKNVREFDFNYTLAESMLPMPDGSKVSDGYYRYFLSSVTEQADCLKRPPYLFTYTGLTGNTVDLPNPGSFKQDFWGYYNGNTATTLSPKLYVYPGLTGVDRYRIIPMKAGSFSGTQVVLDGANRLVDASRILHGTLKQLTYPTGGALEFDFQPNTFFDTGAQNDVTGGGLRISTVKAVRRKIANDPDPSKLEVVKLKEYSYANPVTGLSSGKPIALPMLAFPVTFYREIGTTNNRLTYDELQAGTYSDADKWDYLTIRSAFDLSKSEQWENQPIVYQNVTEKLPGNGKISYEFEVPAVWGETQVGDWDATQAMVATSQSGDPLACPTLGFVSSGFYKFPFAPSTNYGFERGNLKKETVYTEGGLPVKETVYTYQRVSGPEGTVSIQGLSFDQLPSYSTSTIYTEKNGVIMERIVEGAGKPIYLYGKYTMLANVTKVPATQSVKLMDETGASLLTTTTYTYDQGLLARLSMTNSDGTSEQTQFRYPKDFAIPENGTSSDLTLADEASAMIRRMKEKHMFGTVLEKIHSVKLPGREEMVKDASFSAYKPFKAENNTKVYPANMYAFRNGVGTTKLSSFLPSAIINGTNGYVLQLGTGYEEVARIPGYDLQDKALGVEDPRSQRVKASHFGHGFALPVAEITDARADEVVFSNFETETDHGFVVSSPVYGAGRTGTKALTMAQNQVIYRDNVLCGDAAAYTLSAWVKANDASTTSGSITVTLSKNGLATTPIPAYTFNVAANDWTFLQVKVPVDAIGAGNLFKVELKSNTALLLDDILFYPSKSSVTTSTFDPLIGKTSETDTRGITRFYEFDALGNLAIIRDHNRNILQHKKYVYYNETGGLQAGIKFDESKFHYDGEPVPFTAVPLNCQLEGVTYTWDFGDGSAVQTGTTTSHTFPFFTSGKTYRITLTATHKDYGSYQTTKEIVIQPKPLEVTICADGPILYDSCNPNTSAVGGDCTMKEVISGYDATIYKVETISGCSGPYTYQWEIRNTGQEYGNWNEIAGATSSTLTLTGTYSYEVRCVVKGCGRSGVSTVITHIVFKTDNDCEAGQLQPLN